MKIRAGVLGVFVFLAGMAVSTLRAGLPMWLDSPERLNVHDPFCKTFLPPSPVPTQAPIPTGTITPTFSITPNFSPTSTRTPLPTNTFTPVIVVTATNTPAAPNTSTATYTPGSHGPLVADFENNATNDRTLWGGAVFTAGWGGITSITPNPWPANAGLAPGNGSSFCGHIGGTVDTSANGGGAYLALELNMGGEDHTLAATDVTSYSPNSGLRFDYKADPAAVGTQYLVELVQNSITDSAYWRFVLAPTDSNWHTIDVYFPTVAGATNSFQWGSQAWDPTHLGAILFQLNTQAAAQTIGLSIDNVTFAAPAFVAPTATPTNMPGHGPLVADFENNATNDRTLWGGAVFTAGWGGITSITPNPWPANAGLAPGNSSSFCGHIGGTVDSNTNGGGAYLALELNMGGENHTLAATDVTAYSPNQGLQFDYKADPAAVGTQYLVELVQSSITDSAYWRYVLAPADSNWHTLVIYFPGVAGAPDQFNWGSQAWDPTHLGAILFQLNTQATAQTIGLSIDNVTFAAPVVPAATSTFTPAVFSPTDTPTPTATITPGGHGPLVADFENNATNDRTLWGGAVFTAGWGGITSITPNPWPANAGLAPGNGSSFCGHIGGTVDTAANGGGAYLALELNMGGEDHTLAATDVTSYSPNSGLRFDYKADPAAVGTQYLVELVQKTITDSAYWRFVLTPADSNWNTIDIYFPGVTGATNNFAWGSQAWDPTQLGAILIQLNTQATAQTIGLSIDNVTFAAPVAH